MGANGNSFHSSPREALAAAPEEFRYVACLRDGAPDFVAVVVTDDGRVVLETPMPNAISMLGDADGNGACGFAVLVAPTFEVKRDRGRRRTRGLAVPGPRAALGPADLDGRPLPVLLELAARRPATSPTRAVRG